MFEQSQSPSSDVTRALYSTGFVFTNCNSKVAATISTKSELKLKPICPVT